MYVIRDVFRTKAGKGKEFATKGKTLMQYMPKEGVHARRVLTDVVGAYWTVVFEIEVEKLETYFNMMNTRPERPEAEEAMKGYAEIVEGGYREIFKVE